MKRPFTRSYQNPDADGDGGLITFTVLEQRALVGYLTALANGLPPSDPGMRLCYNLCGVFGNHFDYSRWGVLFDLAGFDREYPLADDEGMEETSFLIDGVMRACRPWEGPCGDRRRTFCGVLAAVLADKWRL